MFNRCHLAYLATMFFACGIATDSFRAQASSCSGESGERFEYTSSLMPFEEELLSSIQLAPEAYVISTRGALPKLFEEEPFGVPFDLEVQKSPSQWVFNFSNDQGLRGSLSFALPKNAHYFLVDPLPPMKNNDPSRDFKMYKEWKFTSKSVGKGLFEKIEKGDQQSELIFSGTGGKCLNKKSLHTWRLIIKNGISTVEIFGHLDSFNQ